MMDGDMWEFNSPTKSWNEAHPASVINPGARSAAYLTVLNSTQTDDGRMVLFGGDMENGPVSDLWL